MLFTRYVILIAGKRALQKFLLEVKLMNPDLGYPFGNKFGDFGNKMKVFEYAGIMVLSLLETELWRTFERIPYDITSCRKKVQIRATPTRNQYIWNFDRSASW
ncbi:hypothetical protein AVEN_370-1 [Araneus ventricosus]|uniref:Uncharacterized protein n=1 Tax=Araneus ventricosus TaxID=182803 RepID=A0A4Y2DRW5_ARAVE|nr:hypothetical protein AVEN_370-1 [Araneus ventricosus]